MDKIEPKYLQAVDLIKRAILQSQYNAVRLANQEQLKLYFGIGRYISENSRSGFWGTGALDIISDQLKNDLPGLMGFGVTSLKNMRKFYEAWSELEDNSASALAELQDTDAQPVEIRQVQLPNSVGFPLAEFLSVPFTQHTRIIEGVKEREERIFYIRLTAMSHLTEKGIIKAIKADDYHHRGALPNNFLTTIPDTRSARRAIRAFKDEYLLDFINVEELDADDIEDVDEKVLENEIVDNIRDFMADWETARQATTNELSVLNLGVSYHYDANSKSDKVQVGDGVTLDFTNTSSGLQSLIPLFVHLYFITKVNSGKTASFASLQELKVLTSKLDEEGKMDLYDNYVNIHHCDIFLEEPEANLFPPTQTNLVEWLLEMTKGEQPNNLFIATHSPYILESFLEKPEIDVQLLYTRKDGDKMLIKTATEQDIQDIYDYGVDAFFNIESLG